MAYESQEDTMGNIQAGQHMGPSSRTLPEHSTLPLIQFQVPRHSHIDTHTDIHTHTHTHTYIHTYIRHTYMHADLPTRMHTYRSTYIHTYIHTYIQDTHNRRADIHTDTYILIYTRMYIYTDIYIYIHTHQHVHIYIYICVCICVFFYTFPYTLTQQAHINMYTRIYIYVFYIFASRCLLDAVQPRPAWTMSCANCSAQQFFGSHPATLNRSGDVSQSFAKSLVGSFCEERSRPPGRGPERLRKDLPHREGLCKESRCKGWETQIETERAIEGERQKEREREIIIHVYIYIYICI